jgi:type VI secretion system protein ImpA
MADFAGLLEPISSEQPAGANLYYAKEFDEIKDARRQDDTAPWGLWEHEVKTADYKLVARLAEAALASKTKDLRLAVWLAEAWIYREGTAGLVSGIRFLHALLDKFWDSIYPQIEDGDFEDRVSPLEWFGSYFDPVKGSSPKLAVCRLPLVKGKYDFFVYQESRKVGSEADVKDSEPRKKTRAALIAEGKISAEVFDKVFDETPKAFYKQLDADYKQAIEVLSQFDTFCREKFTKNPPSFGVLRKSIEEIANAVQILLTRKLKTDPDPVEPVASSETPTADQADSAQQAVASPLLRSATIDLSQFGGGAITSTDHALLHVLAAAQFLRRTSPSSPLSYLLLRALRWGEVRESGEIKPAELFAPAGDIRVALRNAAGAQNWQLVLDVAETAMSNLTGRGWLDLQRYSVIACEQLGYAGAAKALRSELKCFLADFPQLPKAILNDDTGAANPETLAWLEKEGLLPPAAK